MINLIANGIPQLWRKLPLVNQAWLGTLKQRRRTDLGHQEVLLALIRLIEIKDAGRSLFASRRLAAPLDPLNENGTTRLKATNKQIIQNSSFILFHERYYIISLSAAQPFR